MFIINFNYKLNFWMFVINFNYDFVKLIIKYLISLHIISLLTKIVSNIFKPGVYLLIMGTFNDLLTLNLNLMVRN
jgi:hypothetical protein